MSITTLLPIGSNYNGSTLNYCCTTPLPSEGDGNISDEPLFVDLAGGNLRLQTNSPCIDAGDNIYVVGDTDLDGNTRIVSGTVDMGAYEFHVSALSPFQPGSSITVCPPMAPPITRIRMAMVSTTGRNGISAQTPPMHCPP